MHEWEKRGIIFVLIGVLVGSFFSRQGVISPKKNSIIAFDDLFY